MARRTEPPERGREPDFHCPYCGSPNMGDKCSKCDLTIAEAKEKYEQEMDERVEQFRELLKEADIHNLDPDKHIRDLGWEGSSITFKPRFGCHFGPLMELPGVKNVGLPRGTDEAVVSVTYKPEEAVTEEDMRKTFERLQRVTNRLGPSKATQGFMALKNSDDVDWLGIDSQDKNDLNLAVEAGLKYWGGFKSH